MAVVKIKEIMGTSSQSFDRAFHNALDQACAQKENVTGAEVLNQTVSVEDGEVAQYKVNVKVAYRWEKELHE